MADLPDGVDRPTMILAIAWEMVETAIDKRNEFLQLHAEERLKVMIDLFGKAHAGVNSPGKWIGNEPEK